MRESNTPNGQFSYQLGGQTSQQQGNVNLHASDGLSRELAQPSIGLPLAPSLSSDDFRVPDALTSGARQNASGSSPDQRGDTVSSERADGNRDVTVHQGQDSAEVTTARYQGDQVVPSNSLPGKGCAAASPGRPPSHTSSSASDQPRNQQDLTQGWDTHRELLVRRAESQQVLHDSSSRPPLSVFSRRVAQLSDGLARQRPDSCYPTTFEHSDGRENPLQRRQNHMHKLPEEIFRHQHYNGVRHRQKQGNIEAGQSRSMHLPAQSPQGLSASGMQSTYTDHEGLKRRKQYYQLNPNSQQPACKSEPFLGVPSPRRLQQHRASDSALHKLPDKARPSFKHAPANQRVGTNMGPAKQLQAPQLPGRMPQLKEEPAGIGAVGLHRCEPALLKPKQHQVGSDLLDNVSSSICSFPEV